MAAPPKTPTTASKISRKSYDDIFKYGNAAVKKEFKDYSLGTNDCISFTVRGVHQGSEQGLKNVQGTNALGLKKSLEGKKSVFIPITDPFSGTRKVGNQ